jgi:hypothetical protein
VLPTWSHTILLSMTILDYDQLYYYIIIFTLQRVQRQSLISLINRQVQLASITQPSLTARTYHIRQCKIAQNRCSDKVPRNTALHTDSPWLPLLLIPLLQVSQTQSSPNVPSTWIEPLVLQIRHFLRQTDYSVYVKLKTTILNCVLFAMRIPCTAAQRLNMDSP